MAIFWQKENRLVSGAALRAVCLHKEALAAYVGDHHQRQPSLDVLLMVMP
jgi:hypothetical protein